MNAPKTYFSTELHTNQQALRCRLDDLFTAPRRRGVFPLVCALLLVSMLGSLVACNTPSAPTVSAPLPTVSLPDLPVTEENRDARTLYAQVLTTLLDENLLPGEINDPAGYTGTVAEREAMTENQFAVCDVDGDGREELVIQYITANMVAGMQALIYDTDENGRLHLQFSEFPNLTFYDNGAIQAGWSHNQGLAGGFWPYTLYVYDPESDLYRDVGSVDAWSRDYQPQNYPGLPGHGHGIRAALPGGRERIPPVAGGVPRRVGGAGAALAESDGRAHPDPHGRRLMGKWAGAVTFPPAPAIYG